jgi:lysozyme family protein
MKNNFSFSLHHVLIHEGGYSDNPHDPGGATMMGVTLAVFRSFFGADKSKEDLRNITCFQLGRVYRVGYWDKCSCNALPAGVDYAVFDSAVNSGPHNAAIWLQNAVGAAPDGAIGPHTLAAVASCDPKTLVDGLLDRRLDMLGRLSTWDEFGRGWKKRIEEVRDTAKRRAAE